MSYRWWPLARPHGPITRVAIEGLPELRFKLHPAGDPWVSGVIARNEVFDPHIMALLRATLESEDVLVDVGAHIGWFSVIGSKLAGHVVAMEPDPDNWRYLRTNLRINGSKNVTAYQVAAGETNGHTRLYRSFEHRGDHQLSVVGDRKDFAKVRVRSVDSVLAEVGIRATWVKLDTQGSEAAILRGMRRTLDCRPRLVLEFWPQGLQRCGASADDLIDLLAAVDGEVWITHADNSAERIDLATLAAFARSPPYDPGSGAHADLVVVPPGDGRTTAYLTGLSRSAHRTAT
jgi:FkbM family methyltransferase